MDQSRDGVCAPDTWGPSWFARLLVRARDWDARLDGLDLVVRQGSDTARFSVGDVAGVAAARGVIWTTVTLFRGPDPIVLSGLSRRSALDIQSALAAAHAEVRRLNGLVAQFTWAASQIERWWAMVREGLDEHKVRWIPLETAGAWAAARPQIDPMYMNVRLEPGLAEFWASQPTSTVEAIDAWETVDVASMVQETNKKFLAEEPERLRHFFDTIESSPLTDEQVESVITFDNRVLTIAAAGSGKTSTMVARAGYAIHRQIAAPDEILLLAFNRKAAEELETRVKKRLGSRGRGLQARTFHSLGREIIGNVTGKTPPVDRDVADDRPLRPMSRIVDEIRDADPVFRRCWDLFRLVYAGFYETPDGQKYREVDELTTLAGERVKSKEELLIANWLFYNGVEYEYERPYEHETADASHRQYTPDFYYPALGIYHEHWGISKGRSAPHLKGYLEGMSWKRSIHTQYGTTLIETTSDSIRGKSGFDHLAAELTSRGIVLDENPNRKAKGPEPLKDADMLGLVHTFILHAKNNRIDVEQICGQYSDGWHRDQLFLYVAAKAQQGWEDSLARQGHIDYEDMLVQAADLIEADRWHSPYKVVMVDEFQDTSVSRTRLIQALTRTPGTYLYGVGDDWQSIYRFAGADLSVMSDFKKHFGSGPTIKLQRTFRSCQTICDVAGAFVMKNDAQFRKEVVSTQPGDGTAVRALLLRSDREYAGAIESCLAEFDTQAGQRDAGKVSVFVLGRYKRDADLLKQINLRQFTNLKIEFSTVHGSKGREADYVLLPGMDVRGFPSVQTDDPVLRLVMPRPDAFPYAEERRLFYVALTRARRQVVMLADRRRVSPFLRELISERKVAGTSSGDVIAHTCPGCGNLLMVRREGRNGAFVGCFNYPLCKGTVDLASAVSGFATRGRRRLRRTRRPA